MIEGTAEIEGSADANKARGMMLRFIIQNRINDPEYLKAFDEEGYSYHNDLSTAAEWIFTR